jgi:hypothetical protein
LLIESKQVRREEVSYKMSDKDKEEERKAIKLQRWQRAKFARELGFDENTTSAVELAAIDKRYEEMLHDVNEWNEEQNRIADARAVDLLKRVGPSL